MQEEGVQRQGMPVIFFKFMDLEQLHPRNFKKITRQVLEGDPCRTPLALALQRKMNVGFLQNEKNAWNDFSGRLMKG